MSLLKQPAILALVAFSGFLVPGSAEGQQWVKETTARMEGARWELIMQAKSGLVRPQVHAMAFIRPETIRRSGDRVTVLMANFVVDERGRLNRSEEQKVIDCAARRFTSVELARQNKWVRLHAGHEFLKRLCQ
jgi:hypothetical protein